MHPAIAELDAHYHRVRDLGSWLQGSDFADERGWLDDEERSRFHRESKLWPWTKGELDAHRDRVRLDHPDEYATWAKRVGEKPRAKPKWRIDRIDHPPRGDLYELELRTTWQIRNVATNALVLELEGCDDFDYSGPGWTPTGGTGVARVRIEGDEAVLLLASGTEERRALQ